MRLLVVTCFPRPASPGLILSRRSSLQSDPSQVSVPRGSPSAGGPIPVPPDCSGVAEPPWPLRRHRPRRPLPLASEAVPAGFPSPADDYIESQIDLHDLLVTSPSSTFFMRASGDAMAAAGIFHGDLLVIDRSVEARPGRYVICTHAGAFLLRRLEGQPPRLWLVAMDGLTPALPLGEGSDAELWGVVVHAVHHLPAGRAASAVRTATMPE